MFDHCCSISCVCSSSPSLSPQKKARAKKVAPKAKAKSKPKPKPKLKPKAKAAAKKSDDASDLESDYDSETNDDTEDTLMGAVVGGAALEDTLRTWYKSLQADRDEATSLMLKFVLEACGCVVDSELLDTSNTKLEDLDVEGILENISENQKFYKKAYPITSKVREIIVSLSKQILV